MNIIFITLAACFLIMPSMAVEDRSLENEKSIVQKHYPDVWKKHWSIVTKNIENLKKRNGSLIERHLSLYKHKEGFVFTLLADHLYDTGLKYLCQWQEAPPKIEEIQTLCKGLLNNNWKIKMEENGVFFLNKKDSSFMTEKSFITYFYIIPSLIYYSLAMTYDIKNQIDYHEQVNMVGESCCEYLISIKA